MNKFELLVIKKIKESDEGAFDSLFREYYAKLTFFAQGFLPDLSTAKGIVQELFITLWERRADLEIKTSIKSYLYQSVRNSCINYINHQKVEEKRKSKLHLPTETEFVDQISLSELEGEIHAVIESLPAQCKKIFLHSRIDNLKYSEIAEKLGISPRTVEVQIGRALKVLREKLKNHIVMFLLISALALACNFF